MWILSIFSWLGKVTSVLSFAGAAGPAFDTMKRYWRELFILVLLIGIGMSGWYYKSKISRLSNDLQNSEIMIETLESNNIELVSTLDEYVERLGVLVSENDTLEVRIKDSEQIIAALNSRPPETIIRTVYEQVIPEHCNGKFEWLLSEAIRLKEVGK